MTQKSDCKDLEQRIRVLEAELIAGRQAENWYRSIFENTGTAVAVLDENTTIILANDKCKKLLGYNKNDLYGKKSLMDFVVKEDLDRMAANYKRLRIDEDAVPENHEFRLKDRKGNVRNVSLTVNTIPDTENSIVSLLDITESKQVEHDLWESQEYTKKLFHGSIIPKIIMDAETGIYIDCNNAAVKIYGYTNRKEVLNKTPFDVSAPTQYDGSDSAIEAQKHIQACRRDGSHVFEWRHQRPNGQIWDAAVHLIIFQYRGKPLIQFTLQDITARKKTEEALRQSEAILHSVFKAAPVGLCIMKGRVYQRANKAWQKSFGYSETDIIGHTTRMLYENDEEYNRVDRKLFTNLPKRGFASVQTRLKRKDGVFRDVIVTSAPLQLEDQSLSVAAIEDITDRKRTEEELKQNRRELANIIEFLPDATFVIDKQGKIIAWNRALETLTGAKKADMIGKGDQEYALPFYGERRAILIDYALHPDREIEKQYTAIQRMDDIIFGEAFTPNLLPGNIHLSGTASVLRDNKGEVIAAIECIRDNTERKRLEERLNRAEKMEALGTLAGGVAHDLNNVLGVMVGYSELLAGLLPENSSPRRYADNILQSSVKGAAIIQDLLTLARRGVNVSEVINLNGLILDYLRTPEFEKLISFHPDMKIDTELEDRLLNIEGSSIHLGKTIMNLVLNASEALSGPGKVTIKTENRYLDYPVRGYDEIKEGDYAVLTVSDTGSGISASDLGKIFEPFYTKKVMGRSGTGLGLAVVWGTVKDHNGYIDVQSAEGRGSTFTLYFPVTRKTTEKIKETVASVSYMGKGESILVVDDVQEQRDLAVSMLEKLGYRVEAVAGGEEAVGYFKTRRADLIVLDMIMDPGIDGLETYRRILKINPGQKAVIVSGFSETDRVRDAQEMGAGAFVRKPYILEKIGLAIRRELDKK